MIERENLPALASGFLATLCGVGIARFAYTALLPMLVTEGWFSDTQAAYLGATNLLGYFFGALAAHALSERYPARHVMSWAFAIIALSFLLCAVPGSYAWFSLWRFAAGFAGAVLMVVGPSMALAATPGSGKPAVGALVFTGIGAGALVSATLVPALLALDLKWTWLALGVLCAAAGLAGTVSMAKLNELKPAEASTPVNGGPLRSLLTVSVLLVIAAYAFDALGFVPHTVFWVDFLAREVDLGSRSAAIQWFVFGLGAIVGPFAAGWLVKRFGWHTSLAAAYLLKAVAIGLPLLSTGLVSRSLSSFIVGAMVPGIVALTAGRLAELVGPTAHKRIWGQATAVFAAAQALSGYAMSSLYATSGSYQPLFLVGTLLLVAGFVLLCLDPRRSAFTR
ncbi:YbfB/YjiJ family MFS transporter [Halopseudomonas salegens]|nr:YbfB/YjiJ family MFS transporter [Halopseudomonas salegens]